MEAEVYLLSGFGLRAAFESRSTGWVRLGSIANVWQPSRLKGIQVSAEYGTPFLAATQVFDIRPMPRKWLALERTENADQRFVREGMTLVTCSGSVGHATLAYAPHLNTLISHDLLRVEPMEEKHWGWLYAYLRTPTARSMMTSAQYGHVIKHLEVSHLNALPIPDVPEPMLQHFTDRTRVLLDLREKAYAVTIEAEARFERAIGSVTSEHSTSGFSISSSALFDSRRRLEGAFHSPISAAILARFQSLGLKVQPLESLTDGVYWMTRFARVFGEEGAPYMSAEELFALNAPIEKRVMIEQAKNANEFFVKAGWIVMACSGQVYGLLGSVALMTELHEETFFSHDLIRVLPRCDLIRPGYLYTALGHPTLGRPLVVRYAYGTSIPHLEPKDIARVPIVRLAPSDEDYIADRAEQAAAWRAQADQLENEIADEAEHILNQFLAGELLLGSSFAH
jgi:hypothetical protein